MRKARIGVLGALVLLCGLACAQTNGTYLGPKDGAQSGATRLAARTLWTANDAVWIGGDKLLAVIEGAPKEG